MPYRPPSPYEKWCPPALTDAALPLDRTHRLLQALCDEHSGVSDLCASAPSPGVHRAVADFLDAYAQAAYELAAQAGELTYNLRLAAQDYVGTEQALRDAALGKSPRTRE